MDDATEKKSLLEQVIDPLMAEGVEFVVIGGQAGTLHGSARVTLDIDLYYRRTAGSLELSLMRLQAFRKLQNS